MKAGDKVILVGAGATGEQIRMAISELGKTGITVTKVVDSIEQAKGDVAKLINFDSEEVRNHLKQLSMEINALSTPMDPIFIDDKINNPGRHANKFNRGASQKTMNKMNNMRYHGKR